MNMMHIGQACLTDSGVWCNWQHNGFWYRHSRFESWYPSESSDSVNAHGRRRSDVAHGPIV